VIVYARSAPPRDAPPFLSRSPFISFLAAAAPLPELDKKEKRDGISDYLKESRQMRTLTREISFRVAHGCIDADAVIAPYIRGRFFALDAHHVPRHRVARAITISRKIT